MMNYYCLFMTDIIYYPAFLFYCLFSIFDNLSILKIHCFFDNSFFQNNILHFLLFYNLWEYVNSPLQQSQFLYLHFISKFLPYNINHYLNVVSPIFFLKPIIFCFYKIQILILMSLITIVC